MKLTEPDFVYLGICLEGFFYGTICSTTVRAPAKAIQHHPIPGLYSGIFALYLQYHRSKKNIDQAKATSILFYALCALYVLSLATFSLDVADFVMQVREVSDNSESKMMNVFSFIIRC